MGKQNKDLLLWKDQRGLGVLLLACLAHSCWCPRDGPIGLGPRTGQSCKDGWLLPGAWLGAVALGEGVEQGLFSEEWCALLGLGNFLCTLCACGGTKADFINQEICC